MAVSLSEKVWTLRKINNARVSEMMSFQEGIIRPVYLLKVTLQPAASSSISGLMNVSVSVGRVKESQT